jgi:hypothetical protein
MHLKKPSDGDMKQGAEEHWLRIFLQKPSETKTDTKRACWNSGKRKW